MSSIQRNGTTRRDAPRSCGAGGALLALRTVHDVDVSPDGRRVAFAVAPFATDRGAAPQARVWIGDVGGAPRAATDGPGRDGLPRFSPDGERLAFASDRDRPGLMGLHLLEPTGEVRAAGRLAGSVEQIAWARDGSHLLVLAADPGSDAAGARSATKVAAHDGGAPGPRVQRPRQAWRRLFRVEAASGAAHEVGPHGLNVWEFGWSGAGDAVAVVSDTPEESAWYGARIALLDLGARRARTLHQPAWQVQSPAISDDGARVAFVEGLASDRVEVAGELTVVDVAGGGAHVLAPGCDLTSVRWLPDGRLLGTGPSGLESACVRIAPDGAVEQLWRGPATLGRPNAMTVASGADGRVLAAAKEAPGEPPEVALLDAAAPAEERAWRPLTRLNAALADGGAPRAERVAWRARDGLELEGILLRPAGGGERRGPLAVLVHGGPANAWTFDFLGGTMGLGGTLAAAGCAVLLPNPRGSTGRGQCFARANLGDLGGEDLQDLLAGVDALVAAGVADRARVAILGKSYGGFMSAWAITQSDAFAAAVPIACVSDWLSFHNTTNIGRFDELYLSSDPYDPGGAHFARSPVTQARGCTTPTLILHGAEDLCTPLGQAQELYQALAGCGCETELVTYPRAGHGWSERDHLIDTHARVRAWLDRHLGPIEGAP